MTSAGAVATLEGILQDSLLANTVCFHSKWYFMGGEGVPGVSCRFWSSVDNHSPAPRSSQLAWGSHTVKPNGRASSAPLGIVTVYSPFPKATVNVLSRTSTGVQPCLN